MAPRRSSSADIHAPAPPENGSVPAMPPAADLSEQGLLRQFTTQTPVQLAFIADPSVEEWAGIGQVLGLVGRACNWWVGDWLVYGEARYGEQYAQGMDATGLDYQTLTNRAWVSRAIAPERRQEHLTWSHHAEIATFIPEDAKQQGEWLARAQKEGWPTRELRARLRAAVGKGEPAARLTPGRISTTTATLAEVIVLVATETLEWWLLAQRGDVTALIVDDERRQVAVASLAEQIANKAVASLR